MRILTVITVLAWLSALPVFAEGKLIISQVYGGGGENGAIYKNDFIELRNVGDAEVSTAGWSVQYAPAGATNWEVTILGEHKINPGQAFLVAEAAGKGGVLDLPQSKAQGGIQLASNNGKVLLAKTVAPQTGNNPQGAQITDFVCYGSGSNAFLGHGPAPDLGVCMAAQRKANGTQDTRDNANDFIASTPFGGIADQLIIGTLKAKESASGELNRPDECRSRKVVQESRASRADNHANQARP